MKKNSMQRRMVILLCILGGMIGYAQQTPQFSHYLVNYFAQNPAAMGMYKCVDIKFGGKLQWLGFDGAPHFYFFSASTQLKTRNNYSRVKHYLGGYISLDNQHIFSTTAIKLAYALHHRLSGKWYAGYGLFGGIRQVSVSNITSDPAIKGAVLHYPDFMPGIVLYNSKSMLGLGIEHLYPKKMKSLANGRFRNQYYFTGFKRSDVGNYHSYLYSFNFKWGYLAPPSLELNMQWLYKKINLGVGYRVGEALILQFKFKINTLLFAYAFDFPLNHKRVFLTNSHEAIIGFSKCGTTQEREEHPCPAYQ